MPVTPRNAVSRIRALLRELDAPDRCATLLIALVDLDPDALNTTSRLLNATVILAQAQSAESRSTLARYMRVAATRVELQHEEPHDAECEERSRWLN